MQQILVIDDDSGARTPLAEFLRATGYDVFEAENGKDGLQIFDGRRIDLVLTDIVMPEKEGLETIMALKARNPHLKIMAMSGSSTRSPEYLAVARKLGAHRVIPKPFDLQAVLVSIQELLAAQPGETAANPTASRGFLEG